MPKLPYQTNLLGVPVTVLSMEEAAKGTYWVCGYATGPVFAADDVLTVCALCGIGVRHRPYAPPKPLKICIGCMIATSPGKTH